MIEQQATVVEVSTGHAVVETARQSSCGSCSSKGCGTGTLAKLFSEKVVRLSVTDDQNSRVGDQVVIGIPESALVRGSLAAYLGPILAMMAGGALGELLANQWLAANPELVVLIFAASGFALGFAWLRWYARRAEQAGRMQARIVRRVDNAAVIRWP